ncbi:hypothetical protein [Kiloniella antarctica]|uniref:Uncharacterized protein n=1 Tax=Kiloniella antarctica TaxID=1550907 RepID=A0ABW5BST0_9PROT
MENQQKCKDYLILWEDKASSEIIVMRKLYILLGQELDALGVLAIGNNPESFAEMRLYSQSMAINYEHSFQLMPKNIFTKSLNFIQQLETNYWKSVVEKGTLQTSRLSDTNNVDGNIDCFVPKIKGVQGPHRLVCHSPEVKKCKISIEGSTNNLFLINPKISGNLNFFERFGYVTLGPVFCTYGLWILAQNSKAPYYGLMREGKFLSNVVSALGGTIGGQIYVSRLTSVKAVLADPNEEEALLNFLLRGRNEPISLISAAKVLGIDQIEKIPLPPQTHISSENISKILRWFEQKEVKEQRLTEAKKCQTNLMRHLTQVTGDNITDLHLLDMGYAGNILANLSKIFAFQKMKIECRGRFLLSSIGAFWAQSKGCEIRGSISQNGAPFDFSTLYFRTPELLELCCSAKSGTTTGYDDMGNPICEQTPFGAQQYQEIEQVQKGVLEFIRDWRKVQPSHDLGKLYHHSMAEVSRSRITRLIRDPTLEEAQRLGRWLYDDNLGVNNLRCLTENLRDSDSLVKSTRSELYWPQALEKLQKHA